MPGKAEVGSGDVDYLLRVAVFLQCIGTGGCRGYSGCCRCWADDSLRLRLFTKGRTYDANLACVLG
jgi:hypothetical protein